MTTAKQSWNEGYRSFLHYKASYGHFATRPEKGKRRELAKKHFIHKKIYTKIKFYIVMNIAAGIAQ
jgi:hypothetical protein